MTLTEMLTESRRNSIRTSHSSTKLFSTMAPSAIVEIDEPLKLARMPIGQSATVSAVLGRSPCRADRHHASRATCQHNRPMPAC